MKRYLILAALLATPLTFMSVNAAPNVESLKGRILLQVEARGQAWYVNPADGNRYFLGTAEDAFKLMKGFGLGVKNTDLNNIPIGYIPLLGTDTDKDGLIDTFEQSQGTDPKKADTDGDTYPDKEEIINGYSPLVASPTPITFDQAITNRLKGKILIQTESLGEAWYVNPANGKRYFLGKPADAYAVMRQLALGITNENLAYIPGKALKGAPVPPAIPVTPNMSEYSATAPKGWAMYDLPMKNYKTTPLDKTFTALFPVKGNYKLLSTSNAFIRVTVIADQAAEQSMNRYIKNGVKYMSETVTVAGQQVKQIGVMYPKSKEYYQIVTVVPLTGKKSIVVIGGALKDDLPTMQTAYNAFLKSMKLR